VQVETMSSVTSRIAQIQARIASVSGAPATVLAPATTEAFSDTLARATASRTAADVTPTYPAATGAATTPWSALPGSTAALTGAAFGAGTPAGGLSAGAVPGVGATAAGSVTATTATSGLGPVDVPPELAAYGNGRIPASALSPIGGSSNHRLWAPAARAYEQMTGAAARAGVTIGITDSYRTYASQVELAERKGLHSQGGLAATPGRSDHGWGKSVDLRLDSEAQAWMRAHGAEYGFTENVSREPWHWTYRAD
jgi:hypothetical protein